MDKELIKPIPKYILVKVRKEDLRIWPEQKGPARFYSYLAKIRQDLVKITVAVKTYKKQWYCKQVAVHGVKSSRCWVKDMEYMTFGYGFRVGWYEEGLYRYKKWYEDGQWYDADCKYYNTFSKTVNPEYVGRFPEYRFSAYRHFKGRCIIEYLKLYEKYPQTEYLLKLGLFKIHDSLTVLKRVAKDKKFCKWLIARKDEIASGYFYVGAIMQAYRTGEPLKQVQSFMQCKKRLNHDTHLQPIKEMFKGKDLERFFAYLKEQGTEPVSYLDYLNACNYLGLDMSLPKNRFPHDFRRWHDIRIDEYSTAKALADETERAELYKQFAAVAEKYMALQNVKKTGKGTLRGKGSLEYKGHLYGYAVFIAKSPGELIREGEMLNHCVGRMNYDRRMVREESLIFFVRNIDSPDVPFVTVEYSPQSKKVLQCYGNNNTRPATEVMEYITKVWQPFANRTVKKIAA